MNEYIYNACHGCLQKYKLTADHDLALTYSINIKSVCLIRMLEV